MSKENEKLDTLLNHPLTQLIQEMAITPARFQIILANGLLEMITNVIIKHHCKNHKIILANNQTYTYATRLLILNEKGLIDDAFYDLLRRFNTLRNKAAHGGKFYFKREWIDQFAPIFPKALPDGQKLSYICNHLTFNYYNANHETLERYPLE